LLTEQLAPIAQIVVYPSGRFVAACDSAATNALSPINVAITFFFIIKFFMWFSWDAQLEKEFILVIIYSRCGELVYESQFNCNVFMPA
jgi:hypothetical protein